MATRKRNKQQPTPAYWPWLMVGLWLVACLLGPGQLRAHTVALAPAQPPSLKGLNGLMLAQVSAVSKLPPCVFCR